jgi:adenylate kinase family enzyme
MSRLQIITGKGGVGKTTFAIQKTMQLSREDKEVFYISLDELLDEKIINETGIQQKYFETTSSMQTYIARKLGSKMIAKWVAEAPFFKALFNILPSLGMMITLGHIIDELEKNPNYIFILDAPATGHTLSLFESTMNYRRIFGRGVLVDDIDKINDFLFLTKAISEHDEILPKFLKDKVDLQKELFESFKSHIGTKVSHVTDADNLSVIQSVDKEMMAP